MPMMLEIPPAVSSRKCPSQQREDVKPSVEPMPKKEPTIREIEKALGFDTVTPIILTFSDAKEFEEKGDPFKEWYEDELREFFKNA